MSRSDRARISPLVVDSSLIVSFTGERALCELASLAPADVRAVVQHHDRLFFDTSLCYFRQGAGRL